MALKRKEFETWMRRMLCSLDEEDGQCIKLLVSHTTVSKKRGEEVGTIKIPKKVSDIEAFINEKIDEIINVTIVDADGIGGVQSYQVQAFFEKLENPKSRYTFRVEADDEDVEEFKSEPPSVQGLTAQLMRHNEGLARTMTMTTGQVMQSLTRQNTKLLEMVEKVFDDKVKMIDAMEELAGHKHERDLEIQGQQFKQRMVEDGYNKLAMLAPILVNKFMGKKMLPEKAGVMEVMVARLMESLTLPQTEQLQKLLTPDQMALLMEIATKYGESAASGEAKPAGKPEPTTVEGEVKPTS